MIDARGDLHLDLVGQELETRALTSGTRGFNKDSAPEAARARSDRYPFYSFLGFYMLLFPAALSFRDFFESVSRFRSGVSIRVPFQRELPVGLV